MLLDLLSFIFTWANVFLELIEQSDSQSLGCSTCEWKSACPIYSLRAHLHINVSACRQMHVEFMHWLCVWGRTSSFTIHIHVHTTHLMMSASQRGSNFTVQLMWDFLSLSLSCLHFQMEYKFPLPRLLYNDIFWLSKPRDSQWPELCYCTDKRK